MDYPRAWAISAATPPAYHDPRCSTARTNAAILCDCYILTRHPEYDGAAQRQRADAIDATTDRTWVIRPGDHVVLRIQDRPTIRPDEAAAMRTAWHERFGDIPVLIVGSQWEVAAVVREAEVERE